VGWRKGETRWDGILDPPLAVGVSSTSITGSCIINIRAKYFAMLLLFASTGGGAAGNFLLPFIYDNCEAIC